MDHLAHFLKYTFPSLGTTDQQGSPGFSSSAVLGVHAWSTEQYQPFPALLISHRTSNVPGAWESESLRAVVG